MEEYQLKEIDEMRKEFQKSTNLRIKNGIKAIYSKFE